MIKYKFIESNNAPFKFLIEPIDKNFYKGTNYEMHIDSPYVRMWLDIKDRKVLYLFDKYRKHISWEQRQKELKNFPIEEKIFSDGYKVVRKREVLILEDDEFSDGREYIHDTLYLNDKFETSKKEIDLYSIDKIYTDYKNVKNSQNEYHKNREVNKQKYLDPNTSKEERIKILYEEVSGRIGILAYHPFARDSDELEEMQDYKKYLTLYYSKVHNKEENYIEYLKAYFNGLRECVIFDIEGEDESKLIKDKCKKAKLLNIFNKYYKEDKIVEPK